MPTVREAATADMSRVFADVRSTLKGLPPGDTRLSPHDRSNVAMRLLSALSRWSVPADAYQSQLSMMSLKVGSISPDDVATLFGMLQSLSADYESGSLDSLPRLIRAQAFSDFLDMSDHLCDAGYADQAIVTAVGVLEQHLRVMAERRGLKVPKDKSGYAHAKAVNEALQGAKAYRGGPDHNWVSGWFKMRDDPAHGDNRKHLADDVARAIVGIREFIGRNPL